ncbi:MAG: 2-oxoacid:acceptor oxidoreductase subunit alpha [Sulfolobales archaeon]|nr:2-oxoacid:acceptor oxidoreductase subunit alpha [Sulfolobales archaeon]MDW7969118.1 2-oxoacid:acceptor oxidoreductase subunit alpha [Sulfolobales archaeon]
MTAGLKFYAGYPITPSSEIFEYLAMKLPERGGTVIQFEDEIASINAVIGASWGGVKAMTATSGPGFSLMVEGLSLAIMTETPLVIAYVMRAGPSTGIATKSGQYDVMQVRWAAHGNYELVVYAPWSVQELYDLTINSFNVSETLRVPVILLSDATLAHIWERVVLKDPNEALVINRKKPKVSKELYKPFEPEEDLVPPMASFGEGYRVMVESLTHDERGYYKATTEIQRKLVWRLINKVRKNMHMLVDSASYFVEDADYVIVSYGSTARSAYGLVKELRSRGVKVGLYRPKLLWPVDEESLIKSTRNAKKVFVVENNAGVYVNEVSRVLRHKEVFSIPVIDVEIPPPESIYEVMKEWM